MAKYIYIRYLSGRFADGRPPFSFESDVVVPKIDRQTGMGRQDEQDVPGPELFDLRGRRLDDAVLLRDGADGRPRQDPPPAALGRPADPAVDAALVAGR